MKKVKKSPFFGVITALITPFRDGEIDYPSLKGLIERQIRAGVDGILFAGTTGEGATLTFAEYGDLIAYAKETVAGRTAILSGCGSNCTSRAAELAKIVTDAGADALLSVTPYYNKTNEIGIVKHFEAIAGATDKPVILYNVPSRTGFSLTLDAIGKLAEVKNIVGIKEASGNLHFLSQIVSEYGNRFDVFTGNDDQTLPAMRLGAKGVISVTSNILPVEIKHLTDACLEAKWKKAEKIQRKTARLTALLFEEVNPIPVKYAASLLGLCRAEYRLPLCQPTEKTKEKLQKLIFLEN